MKKQRNDDTGWLVAVIVACMLIMASAATEVKADVWIDVHGISKHGKDTYYEYSGKVEGGYTTRTTREYNSRNYGLGISNTLTQNVEWIAGFYRNSYYKQSLYTGFDLHTTDRAPVGYGISFGLVSGYEDTDNPPVMVLPNIRMGNKHVRLKLGVLPVGVKLVTLSVSFKF